MKLHRLTSGFVVTTNRVTILLHPSPVAARFTGSTEWLVATELGTDSRNFVREAIGALGEKKEAPAELLLSIFDAIDLSTTGLLDRVGSLLHELPKEIQVELDKMVEQGK